MKLRPNDYKLIHNALQSGDLNKLRPLGKTGALKYKKHILRALTYERNSFAANEPYSRAFKLAVKINHGEVTDEFKTIIDLLLDALTFDINSGIQIRDDVIYTLSSQYFRGALTSTVLLFSDLINYDPVKESHLLNSGYYEVLQEKVAMFRREGSAIDAGKVAELNDIVNGNNGVILSDIESSSTGSLFGMPKPESLLQQGDWVKLTEDQTSTVTPSSLLDDEMFSFGLEFDARNNDQVSFESPSLLTSTSDEKELSITKNETHIEDFTTPMDKLDFDKEHNDRDVRKAVALEEQALEDKLAVEIKTTGTDAAERSRLNAVWHTKKKLGLIPKDEELPPELVIERSSTPDENKIMIEALNDIKKAQASDEDTIEVSPLALANDDDDDGSMYIEESDEELNMQIFGNGPQEFMPELSDVEVDKLFSDSNEDLFINSDVSKESTTQPTEENIMEVGTTVTDDNTKEPVWITAGPLVDNGRTDKEPTVVELRDNDTVAKWVEEYFVINKTVLSNDSLILIRKDYGKDVSTVQMEKLTTRGEMISEPVTVADKLTNFANDNHCQFGAEFYVHAVRQHEPVRTSFMTRDNGPVYATEAFDEDELAVLTIDGYKVFDVNGMPILIFKENNRVVTLKSNVLAINGVFTDMFIELYFNKSVVHNKDTLDYDAVDFQLNIVKDDKTLFHRVKIA